MKENEVTSGQLREWANGIASYARPIWARLSEEVIAFLRSEAARREQNASPQDDGLREAIARVRTWRLYGYPTQATLDLKTILAAAERDLAQGRKEAMSEDLKPCPFCGKAAGDWFWPEPEDHRLVYYAECRNGRCLIQPNASAFTKTNAARRWDKRTP